MRNRTVLAATLAVSLCVGVFVASQLGSQSLWIDETLTVMPVLEAENLQSLVDGVVNYDTQPPASHFILYALKGLLPRTEFGLRLPSFIYIQSAILVGLFVIRRYWDTATALLFASFCEISPLLAFYSAEARNYGLWFLASVGAYALFARWLESAGLLRRPADGKAMVWGLALGAVNAVGLWTHLFHVFVIGGQVVALAATSFIHAPERRLYVLDRATLRSAAASLALTSIAFLPWLWVILREASRGEAGVPWIRPFGIMNGPYYVYAAHFGMSFGPNMIELHEKPFNLILTEHPLAVATAGAVVSGTLLVYLALLKTWATERTGRWQLVPLALAPAVMILPPLAYGLAASFPLHIRHFLFVWPVLPLVLALGALRTRFGALVYAAAFVVASISTFNLLVDENYSKDDARGAVSFAESSSHGKVVILGEAARFYCSHATCYPRSFHAIEADTDHLWLLYNRGWASENRKFLDRVVHAAESSGLRKVPVEAVFHGIELMHWSKEGS